MAMQLRVDKRKPDKLDPTMYDSESLGLPKRKFSRANTKFKTSKKTASSEPPSVLPLSEFMQDTFTENEFHDEAKCVLCGGDRNMVFLSYYEYVNGLNV